MKTFTLLIFTLFTSASFNLYSGQTVKIGTQEWTTKNLDVSTFRNGDSIPEAKTDEEWEIAGKNEKPAWCYYENDSINGLKYGKLYNWHAVNDPRGLAPVGFHIPTYYEWTELIDFLGGAEVAAIKIKSTRDWRNEVFGTNESGFSALPSGTRRREFCCIGTPLLKNNLNQYMETEWWCATKINYRAWASKLYHGSGEITMDDEFMYKGLSVRCLKD